MHSNKISRFRTKTDALSLASKLFEAVDSPRSLALEIALRYGDHLAVLSLKDVNSRDYQSAEQFYLDYQCSKLLAKSKELRPGIDTQEIGRVKFNQAEDSCRETNAFLRNRNNGSLQMLPHVERVFQRARDKIVTILGDVPSLEKLDLSFGPGASFGVRGDTSVYKKVNSNLECTYAMAAVASDILSECPGWIEGLIQPVNLVQGSQLSFVPKDANTDRPICIEPLLNGFVQKGIGTWLRNRLSRFGVNLNDQSINQRLAQKAFSHGLSTIDLQSASDTIAYLLVMELLPFDWFEFLDVYRSPRYLDGDQWMNFQKFSSMGNGYTFELETIIFYALACASCEEEGLSYSTGENLHVYGDDIVIPRKAYQCLTSTLYAVGFTVNASKSFYDGVFFESCGCDYYLGTLVRPIFFKDRIDRKLTRAFYAANSIRRIVRRIAEIRSEPIRLGLDRGDRDVMSRINRVYDWCVAAIPQHYRVRGPEGVGDGHLISDFDEATPSKHPTWEGWSYFSYRELPRAVRLEEVNLGYALYFNRSAITVEERDLWADRPYRFSFPIADTLPPNNGKKYSLRGETYITLKRSFCASEWVGWSDSVGFGHGTITDSQESLRVSDFN